MGLPQREYENLIIELESFNGTSRMNVARIARPSIPNYLSPPAIVFLAIALLLALPAVATCAGNSTTTSLGSELAEKIIKHLHGLTGKVVKVSQGQVYIDIGLRNGARDKQKFHVFRKGESIVNDQGEELGAEQTEVGSIVLTKCDEKLSIARPENEEFVIKEGDLVEQEQSELRVAVLPFNVGDFHGCSVSDGGEQPLQDAIVACILAKRPSTQIVEKSLLDPLIGNLKVENTSGFYDTGSVAQLGGLVGASVVVVGRLSCTSNILAVDCHIVNATTGLLLAAPSITKQLVEESAAKPDAQTTQEYRITDKGGFTKADRKRSRELWESGRNYVEVNMEKTALKVFAESWKVMPTAEVANEIGQIFLKCNPPQTRKAIAWFKRSLKVAPDYRPAKVNLSIALSRLKQR